MNLQERLSHALTRINGETIVSQAAQMLIHAILENGTAVSDNLGTRLSEYQLLGEVKKAVDQRRSVITQSLDEELENNEIREGVQKIEYERTSTSWKNVYDSLYTNVLTAKQRDKGKAIVDDLTKTSRQTRYRQSEIDEVVGEEM